MQEDALTLIDHALAAFGQSPDHLWLVVEHAVESCPRGLTAIDAALDELERDARSRSGARAGALAVETLAPRGETAVPATWERPASRSVPPDASGLLVLPSEPGSASDLPAVLSDASNSSSDGHAAAEADSIVDDLDLEGLFTVDEEGLDGDGPSDLAPEPTVLWRGPGSTGS